MACLVLFLVLLLFLSALQICHRPSGKVCATKSEPLHRSGLATAAPRGQALLNHIVLVQHIALEERTHLVLLLLDLLDVARELLLLLLLLFLGFLSRQSRSTLNLVGGLG